MIINFDNLFVLFIYFVLAFYQFTSIFLITARFSNNFKIRILYAASSPFIFILLGFPFKIGGYLNIYVILQLLIFFFITLILIGKIKVFKNIRIFNLNILLKLVIISFLIHFFSFEARNFYSWPYLDMMTAHRWNELIISGSSNNFTYQPGLSIYLAPLYFLVDPGSSLDYLGFAIGIVLLIFTLLVLDQFRQFSGIFFVALLTIPLFSENQKYLVSFGNNQFFILYIPLILYLVYRLKDKDKENNIYLFLLTLILLSLTITNPALTLYIGYLLILFTITLPLIFKFSFRIIMALNTSFLLGVVFYLYNMRMGVSEATSFFLDVKTDLLSTPNTYDYTFLDRFKNLFFDIMSFKVIQNPFDSVINFGVYLSVVLFAFLFFYAITKKDFLYFLFGITGIVWGFSAITGFGQYSVILERVGWYYTLVFLIVVTLLIKNFVAYYRIEIFLVSTSFLMFFYNSFFPFQEYRFDNEIIHLEMLKLTKNYSDTIQLYSTLTYNDIHFIANKNIQEVESLEELKKCIIKSCEFLVVIIDKKRDLPNPYLLRTFTREQINDEQHMEYIYERRLNDVAKNLNLKANLVENGFTIYFENNEGLILVKG